MSCDCSVTCLFIIQKKKEKEKENPYKIRKRKEKKLMFKASYNSYHTLLSKEFL